MSTTIELPWEEKVRRAIIAEKKKFALKQNNKVVYAKLSKTFVAHVSMPKKTSQSGKKRSCKMSSMNKSKKRSLKFYKGQGK